MSSTTLVLNADVSPVSVIPLSVVDWKDAIRVVLLDRAVVMEEYDCWVVRSQHLQMRMPSVIMLKEHQKHNGKVEFSRQNVYMRDNFHCQYCNGEFHKDELTYDHVVPKANGGKTEWTNISSACYPCNQKKAHHSEMKPIRKPERPTYWELANVCKTRPITVPDESWIPYLGWKTDVNVDTRLRIKNVDQDFEAFSLNDIKIR